MLSANVSVFGSLLHVHHYLSKGCTWQHGRVVETGRHQELVDRNGMYAGMWSRQVEATSTANLTELEAADQAAPQKDSKRPAARAVPAVVQQDGQVHHHGH